MTMGLTPASDSNLPQFERIGQAKISHSLLTGKTTVTQRVKYGGREYDIFVKEDGKLTKEQAATAIGKTVDKMMTLAEACKLGKTDKHGVEISSLNLTSKGELSLNNTGKGKKVFTHDEALARLEGRADRSQKKLESKQRDEVMDEFLGDSTPGLKEKLAKLEHKITNLETARNILKMQPKVTPPAIQVSADPEMKKIEEGILESKNPSWLSPKPADSKNARKTPIISQHRSKTGKKDEAQEQPKSRPAGQNSSNPTKVPIHNPLGYKAPSPPGKNPPQSPNPAPPNTNTTSKPPPAPPTATPTETRAQREEEEDRELHDEVERIKNIEIGKPPPINDQDELTPFP